MSVLRKLPYLLTEVTEVESVFAGATNVDMQPITGRTRNLKNRAMSFSLAKILTYKSEI